ncbi:cytochrome c [Ruegeria sp. YS9]|uniref:c-type cytochrome n=1 Tax=Ruegeria sp. YS9 TaxID=2966453 RepID=UPI00214B8210|nr:cytochrome c [Ruegeria sp. YS9]UUV05512.1 cytochrome c [Ruegeria sp. YS9]
MKHSFDIAYFQLEMPISEEEQMLVCRGLLLSIFAASAALAQDIDLQNGHDLYRTYCWQCHGFEATGDGPMAEMLAIRTPDLTRLAAQNDGVFPIEAVARQIDGRAPLLAHGGEMPIFGPALDSDQKVALTMPDGQPMFAGVPLANVIAYLESIQTE